MLDAVSLLRSMEGENPPQLGRRVVVYGGGNTAIDAARTAKRLGAEEAIIVYRRTRERMPAHDFEVEEALDEGVLMKWLSTIKHVDGGKLVVERMELDETGFPQPTGELEELEADSSYSHSARRPTSLVRRGRPGPRDRGRRRLGRPNDDDRLPGHLRGRGHGSRRADRDGGRRARQAGGSHIDAWLRGAEPASPPSSASRRTSSF